MFTTTELNCFMERLIEDNAWDNRPKPFPTTAASLSETVYDYCSEGFNPTAGEMQQIMSAIKTANEPHEENQGSSIVVDAVTWVTMYCDLAEILAERDGVELTTVTDDEGNEAYTDDAGEAWLGCIEEAETILGRLGMNKQRS